MLPIAIWPEGHGIPQSYRMEQDTFHVNNIVSYVIELLALEGSPPEVKETYRIHS
jgi:hypothetical protein